MAATIECTSCGAPAPAAGSECEFCGTVAAAPPPPPSAAPGDGTGPAFEAIPADLPRAHEARRIRGLAVPLVAAVVVLGIGLPLTAVAVSQVGRLPATDLVPSSGGEAASTVPGAAASRPAGQAAPAAGGGRGQARLAGAVVYEGAISPIGCTGGPPKLALFEAGAERYSVLMNAPGVAPGTYPLGTANATFVAVTKIAGGSQTWTSLGRAGAKGDITVGANSSVSARFSGLEGAGGGAEGTIEGTVEVRCG